jgi:hypothetical protein
VNVLYVNKEGERVRQYTKGDKVKVYRVDAEGNEIKDPVLIGNGSTVLANFSYYQTGKGAGHRLENIKVLDLVAFQEGTGGGATIVVPKITEDEEEAPKSEKKGNGEGKRTKSGQHTVSGVHEDLDDKIPW